MDTKIKKLVIAKHFVLKSISDIAYNEDSEEYQKFLFTWAHNFSVLSELLNIEITVGDLFHKNYNIGTLISSYLTASIDKDKILEKVHNNYGKELSILYYFFTSFIALSYLSSVHSYGDVLEKTPPERKKFISGELKRGDKFVREYFKLWGTSNFVLDKYLSVDIIEQIELLGTLNNTKKIDYIKVHEITNIILNKLFPEYREIEYNLVVSQELIDKIEKCKPGLASWAHYEKICVESLRYLFFPEFETIFFQKRTENGHQIRDVIMPNTAQTGFWAHIRSEFNSKNIIAEFKNGITTSVEKNSLNQLRIYLSKKTIGKFGLLFVRNKPSKAMLTARRLAYEESGILILLIDDLLLKKLLACKALMGSCNELLQKEKVRFEIEY